MTNKVSIKDIKDDSITVKYKGEKIRINITNELGINEQIINNQLKESPSSYAFLLLLKSRSLKERDLLERKKDIAYSEAYIYYKNSGAKNITNEQANHKANTNKKYISYYNKWIKACNKADILIGLCKAYENRERILQTVSANLRKEH